MKPVIQFENVSKSYRLGLTRTSLPSLISTWARMSLYRKSTKDSKNKILWALQDISFKLNQGESLALIGPNGAGKTTILKLLAHITQPTSGVIKSDGRISALIELGAGFHPDLTGGENIYLNGSILGLTRKEIEARFDEIVAFSDLDEFIYTPVKRYSSGMVVRLGFAVAACIEPEILLVDEVLAVGDAAFREKCLNRIKSLLEKGTSIIFVSHNLYLVKAICSSSLYLQKGRIIYSGTTTEAIKLYEGDLHRDKADKYVASNPERKNVDPNIHITKVCVSGIDYKQNGGLQSISPAKIEVHYVSKINIGLINVAATIIRSDGLTCCMVRTSLDDLDMQISIGEGVISVILDPIQLVGGMYFVDAFILNESDSMVIVSGSSDWFSVAGTGLAYEEARGVFEPNTRWHHDKV
jgi:lipopolysaccharide transport system ATP-binding protein